MDTEEIRKTLAFINFYGNMLAVHKRQLMMGNQPTHSLKSIFDAAKLDLDNNFEGY